MLWSYTFLYFVQVDTKHTIIRNVCTYKVILKRKAQVDQMMEGLSALGNMDMVSKFPDLLKPLFAGGSSCRDVQTCAYLKQFIYELDEDGRLITDI